jgi:hypothetical protein
VDGKPASWVTANYVLRGIELPPGAHRVHFEYESNPLRLGLLLSSVAVLALVGLSGAVWWRRRRARSAAA